MIELFYIFIYICYNLYASFHIFIFKKFNIFGAMWVWLAYSAMYLVQIIILK